MNIGFAGSHRTGKTTLARRFAQTSSSLTFVKTETTEVFRQYRLQPSAILPFALRLEIQERILDAYEAAWQREKGCFVTDRTPLDLVAYTLADIQGATEVDFAKLTIYIARCFASTNNFFKLLCVIQPGIPLVYAEGKAALNAAYIEHLNSLIIGLCHDERLNIPVLTVKREVTDLDARLELIQRAVQNLTT